MLDISALIPEGKYAVLVEEKTPGGDSPAWCVETAPGIFQICISNTWIKETIDSITKGKNYTDKQFKDYYNVIKAALYAHECCHIRYDSFSIMPAAVNRSHDAILRWIDNLLEDIRIEYQVAIHFPEVRKLIEVVNALDKALNCASILVSFYSRTGQDAVVNNCLDSLYAFARFGTIKDKDDADFISFIIPRVYSAMRGSRANCIEASYAIFGYIAQWIPKYGVVVEKTPAQVAIDGNHELGSDSSISAAAEAIANAAPNS